MQNKQRHLVYIWRAILYLASITLLFWLFYQNLVPSGVLVLRYKKNNPASPISDLHPEKRGIELFGQGNQQSFYVDPVYFDVAVPRQFDKVIIDIAWQNQAQPILELGARKAREEFNFVLKPLQNKIIDNLKWPCERFDGILFCQKARRYQSLSDYFAKPSGRLITYHYSPADKIKHDEMNVRAKMDDYDYLMANYELPKSLGNDWHQRRVEYDWRDFALYVNEISFIVSAPELNLGHGQVIVGDITVILQRPPLDWKGFGEYLKNQVRRLKK